MTNEEHYDIIHILTTETWGVRAKMLEYLKTVKVEEPPTVTEILEEQESVEIPDKSYEPEEWVRIQEQFLSGKQKPDYPEYTGEPTF